MGRAHDFQHISELIAIAGGVDIFPELAGCKSAKNRITTPEAVIGRAPDIIVGSWCGKKFSRTGLPPVRVSVPFPRSAITSFTRLNPR
jgi:hypothetical protein